MNLRVARKIYNAVGGPRDQAYSEKQKTVAFNRMERTRDIKSAHRFWHNLMRWLGPIDRAQIVKSWSPADAFNLLMNAPESEWKGDKTVELFKET